MQVMHACWDAVMHIYAKPPVHKNTLSVNKPPHPIPKKKERVSIKTYAHTAQNRERGDNEADYEKHSEECEVKVIRLSPPPPPAIFQKNKKKPG